MGAATRAPSIRNTSRRSPYHHNTLEAYFPIAVAILDSGLTCSASISCPAEMGASIHIKGTGSSIIDTVLVCRSTGSIPRRWGANLAQENADQLSEDIQKLAAGSVEATQDSPILPECAQQHENIVMKALSATWEK